jgi:hypothetical protein
MNLPQRIQAFAALGDYLRNLSSSELEHLTNNAANDNSWFTPVSVEQTLTSIASWLTEPELQGWVSSYPTPAVNRTVALVMAGNIPLVGFHDLLATLISGHAALIKLSSKDRFLPSHLIGKLIEIEPAFAGRITLAEQLKSFDAVIATGSDNSARYFEYYFGKYPHIIRKNRTSVAILSGEETQKDLESLGKDIFSYYGLGCRNVSKLFVPKGYLFDFMFRSIESYAEVINHHKYANNYDYQKSILLINSEKFLDNGFTLLRESQNIVSPISVLFYEFYISENELADKLNAWEEKIQVVVGGGSPMAQVNFGAAQNPTLEDYADKVDTMAFLAGLK